MDNSHTPVLDFFPTGLLITEHDVISKKRLITYANAYFTEAFGFEHQTLVGRLLTDIFTKASLITLDSYVLPLLIHEHKVSEVMLDIRGPWQKLPVIVNATVQGEHQIYWSIADAFKRDELYEELLKTRDQLENTAHRLHAQSLTDDLTGLNNRRALESEAERILSQHKRTARTVALCVLDIDHFKRINDSLGHAAGDELLMKIGAMLRSVTRDTDVVARYGGEEFVILMPETKADEAIKLATRIHQAMAELPGSTQSTTISIGIVESQPDDKTTLQSLFQKADEALYQAKRTGRNRTVMYQPE